MYLLIKVIVKIVSFLITNLTFFYKWSRCVVRHVLGLHCTMPLSLVYSLHDQHTNPVSSVGLILLQLKNIHGFTLRPSVIVLKVDNTLSSDNSICNCSRRVLITMMTSLEVGTYCIFKSL